jgi:two-component system LytT family response regulator
LAEVDVSIRVLAVTGSIRATAEWLLNHDAPDLIFMDIELSDGQCFELFKEVEVRSPVIFTTSYDEFALKAFRYNSIDYLLKPISAEDVKLSLSKVRSLRQQLGANANIQQTWEQLVSQINSSGVQAAFRDRFLVKQGERFFSIDTSEIAYFFSKGKVSFIKSKNGKQYFVNYTLDQLEKMLSPKIFNRINRQLIASAGSVVQINSWFNGKLKLVLSPPFDEEVVVSRDKAREFRQWMGE